MVTARRTLTPSRMWLGGLLLAIMAVALIAPAGVARGRAAAQSAPVLTKMAASVMPEYDQPRVLVSYRGEFSPDVSLPFQAHMRLPADATIEQVCSVSDQEERLCQPYSADPDGEYLAVTWEATTPIMYVEYYYGSVSGPGERSLDFELWPPYAVQDLDLFVLEPAAAGDFVLSPAPINTVEDQGFRHHSFSFQDLPADEPLSIEMTYTRETDQPWALAPPATVTSSDGGGTSLSVILALSLAGAGVLAFVVVGVITRRIRVRRLAPVLGAAASDGGADPDTEPVFCRHCGGTVRPGSAFCTACGQEATPSQRERG